MASSVEDVSNLTVALVGLGGVAAGAILQALTGFLTDLRAERRAHRAWVRDQRLDAYSAFFDKALEMLYLKDPPSDPAIMRPDSFIQSLHQGLPCLRPTHA